MTRMYGPAVRCKKKLRSGSAVLHQCIRPRCGAVRLRAIMDISAPAISLAVKPQEGYPGHQCSQTPGRPFSITSFRLADLGGFIELGSCFVGLRSHDRRSFVRPQCRSFAPACASFGASRAGSVKAGRRAAVVSIALVCRPRLDGTEHGARLRRVGIMRAGARHCRSSLLRNYGPWPAPPR